jgi:hypothetical protein
MWGGNQYGQLGFTDGMQHRRPRELMFDHRVTLIAFGGLNVFAQTSDGVYAWYVHS